MKMERLAQLKMMIKELDNEAKVIQAELIKEDAPDKMKTQYGTLVKASRVNWMPISNEDYIARYNVQAFLEAATITVSGVKKAFGEAGLTKLEEDGLKREKSVSQYYSLRK